MSSSPFVAPEIRAQTAARLANALHWKAHTISTSKFTLKAYGSPAPRKTQILTVYIEGDGLAWLSADTPSNNPTPMTPIGLEMALHDQKHDPVVYLARPCQYVFDKEWVGCHREYWTNARFSQDIIDSANQALDYLKNYYHAKQILLIGYSGGGTIATLVAAKRMDVIQLITVAAVLDTAYWVEQQNLTPLWRSLNPADFWQNLISVPQVHWVGGKDTVVPKEVAFAYAKHFPLSQKPNIIVVPAFDHSCCWATEWVS